MISKRKTYFAKAIGLIAAAVLFFGCYDVTVSAKVVERMNYKAVETGATGYPVVVPAPGWEGHFIQPAHLSTYYLKAGVDMPLSEEMMKAGDLQELGFQGVFRKLGYQIQNGQYIGKYTLEEDFYHAEAAGLYELGGMVVYLEESVPVRARIIGNYYMDANGMVKPYTPETKPAIDAEMNAVLAQRGAGIKALYGAELKYNPTYSLNGNLKFSEDVMNILASYPAGSVPLITAGSKNQYGNILKFSQLYNENDMQSYSLEGQHRSPSNYIELSAREMDRETTAHELGHSIEGTLNTVAGGKLKETFAVLNGGAVYSSNYVYAWNDAGYCGTMPRCFRRPYAATDFSEDFAETFTDALCQTVPELTNRVNSGAIAPEYYQKVIYVKQLFNQYAGAPILQ